MWFSHNKSHLKSIVSVASGITICIVYLIFNKRMILIYKLGLGFALLIICVATGRLTYGLYVINSGSYKIMSFTYNNKSYSTCDTFKLIGTSKDYSFFFNSSSSESYVFRRADMDSLRVKRYDKYGK